MTSAKDRPVKAIHIPNLEARAHTFDISNFDGRERETLKRRNDWLVDIFKFFLFSFLFPFPLVLVDRRRGEIEP